MRRWERIGGKRCRKKGLSEARMGLRIGKCNGARANRNSLSVIEIQDSCVPSRSMERKNPGSQGNLHLPFPGILFNDYYAAGGLTGCGIFTCRGETPIRFCSRSGVSRIRICRRRIHVSVGKWGKHVASIAKNISTILENEGNIE